MDNVTLGQIQAQIEFTRNKLELLFQTIGTSDNFLAHTDHMHGKRNINIFIRLDELSIEKLEEALPTIKQTFAAYQDLRRQEKTLVEKSMIEQKIQRDILNDIRSTKTKHSIHNP